MGKLTWQQLGLIYEGNFGVDPTEAAAIISEHLFTKNWTGDKDKIGRMWQDQEICAAFVWYLKEVEKYQKKNRLSFTKAVERMCLEKHPEHNQFLAYAKIKRLKPKRFRNLVSIWLKLPFVKTKTKVYSKSYMAQLKQIKNKLQKRAAELKKADLQKKKSSSILAARRK